MVQHIYTRSFKRSISTMAGYINIRECLNMEHLGLVPIYGD